MCQLPGEIENRAYCSVEINISASREEKIQDLLGIVTPPPTPTEAYQPVSIITHLQR